MNERTEQLDTAVRAQVWGLSGRRNSKAANCVLGRVARNDRVSIMAKVAYEVTPAGDQWLVTRDGQPGMSYVSQEAAYEVACSEAAGDLRTGHEVRIDVLGNAYNRMGDGSSPGVGTT
jgi:hypothetical protein